MGEAPLVTEIDLEVRPGSRDSSVEWDGWRGAYRLRVTARPTHGAANAAVLELLVSRLGVSSTAVEWVVAGKGRSKRVRVHGLSPQQIRERLVGSRASGSAARAAHHGG